MKKVFKIALLTFAFVLFSNVAQAQSTSDQNAMSQTEALKDLTNFSMEKFKPVYAVYLKYDNKLQQINSEADAGSEAYKVAMNELNEFLVANMRKLLNKTEFSAFSEQRSLIEAVEE